MSWIDKKYKNHFKEQKYPEGMKQKGWDSMQSLLDKQMPVSTLKTITSNPWYLSGVAAIVVAVVGIPFFIANQTEETGPVQGELKTIQISPNEEISSSPNPKNIKPSDFSTEEVGPVEADVAVQSVHDNASQVNSDVVEQEVQSASSVASNAAVSESNLLPASNAVEPQSEESVDNMFATEPEVTESNLEQDEVAEGKGMNESAEDKDLHISIAAVAAKLSEAAEVDEPEELVGKESIFTMEEFELVKNETEEFPEESVAERTAGKVSANSAEPEADLEEKEVILATSESAAEEIEKDETVIGEVESLSALKTTNNTKAAHLAFLEAEDQAPIPDLLTFSKERFALSVWGGYLFTGKVLTGGDQENIDSRIEAEKPIYTTPTGVGLDYFLDEHWTVGVGLGWAEYGEEVDYSLYKITSTIDTVAFDGRFDSPSNYPNIISIDSTRIIDTINQGHWNYRLTHRNDDSTGNHYSGRNTFRYIEVPLTVGYRFGSGRIKPWVKAGVIVGLPIEASYRYPYFETSTYSEGGNKSSLAAIQYSGLVQVGVDFYINRSLSARLNALGTYQINSVLSNEGVRQRYYRLGASLGLAYNF